MKWVWILNPKKTIQRKASIKNEKETQRKSEEKRKRGRKKESWCFSLQAAPNQHQYFYEVYCGFQVPVFQRA